MNFLDVPTRTPLQLLERGLERIKQGHCFGSYARDINHRRTLPDADDACSWCALGALGSPGTGPDREAHIEAIEFLVKAIGADGVHAIPRWNDNDTQDGVVHGYERAIELCKAAS